MVHKWRDVRAKKALHRAHGAALVVIELLWGAEAGTPEGKMLEALGTFVDAYEKECWPSL